MYMKRVFQPSPSSVLSRDKDAVLLVHWHVEMFRVPLAKIRGASRRPEANDAAAFQTDESAVLVRRTRPSATSMPSVIGHWRSASSSAASTTTCPVHPHGHGTAALRLHRRQRHSEDDAERQ